MPDTQTGRPGGGLCAGHSPLPTARGAARPATESLTRDPDPQDPRPVFETAASVSPRLLCCVPLSSPSSECPFVHSRGRAPPSRPPTP
jgi:hypothetical protein